MKKITSSVYTFEDIIKDEFLYVDKTEFIWSLISQGKAMYFLSRPRLCISCPVRVASASR